MRLVYKSTGLEVKVGDRVLTTSRGTLEVLDITKPHHPASTGRVRVLGRGDYEGEYYPSVIDAEWIEREDRGETPRTVLYCPVYATGEGHANIGAGLTARPISNGNMSGILRIELTSAGALITSTMEAP